MTTQEMMAAFRDQTPVRIETPTMIGDEFQGEIRCRRISAVIYRHLGNGRIIQQAEIEDYNGHSVLIVNPNQLRGAEE